MNPRDTTPTAAQSRAGFSVREFADDARGSHRHELHLDAYAGTPLDPATLDLVALLARLERSALSYLRSVLVTPTHSDARVTAFLITWAYEKFWIADALELVVGAHPDHQPAPVQGISRWARAWYGLNERLEPIRESVVANLIGDDVTAVHLLTAAVDEWVVQAAYETLAADENQEFARTAGLLLDVKRRHGTYFATEAAVRLEASPGAGRLARRRLRRTALPIGSRTEPPALVSRLFDELVTAPRLADLDERVDGLPGLAGLGLLRRAAVRVRTKGEQA